MHIPGSLRFLLAATVAVLLLSPAPATGAGEGTFKVPVREKVLDNGLKVLVVENPGARTVACRLLYKVGSANESPGHTGVAHFLEHLMFKGTDTLGVKDLEKDASLRAAIDAVANRMRAIRMSQEKGPEDGARLVELRRELEALFEKQREVVTKNEVMETYRNAGGTGINAMTSNDMTMYICTLPANKLELFMWVEADRLQNVIFREFHAEKDVVREERRLSENRPAYEFNEALSRLVYAGHPYSWPVIGYHEDLENARREDVRRFFDTFYAPDNAVMVLAGAVKAERAFELAERYFGKIPRARHARPELPKVHAVPRGERRLAMSAKTQSRVDVTYYRKPAGDRDEVVYQVIANLLNGESGRLEKALVRGKGLATGARASARPSKYLSTFGISGRTKGRHTPDELLAAIDEVTAKLASDPADEGELRMARNALRARTTRILKRDGYLAMVLAMYEAMGGWESINTLVTGVASVTAEDVRRVAGELFRPGNRVVGLLYGAGVEMPDAGSGPGEAGADTAKSVPGHPRDLTYPELEFEVPSPKDVRVGFENGIRIFIREEPRYPTVTITASFRGGSLWEPAEKTGLAAATGELMKRGGTAGLTEDQLDEALGLLAAEIDSDIGPGTGSVSMTCFDGDVDEVLGHFAEVLLRPAFRADRLERWKEERLQAIARRNDNPRGVSRRQFRRATHGDHPAARVPTAETVKAITREDLVALHRSLISPKNLVLSVAGNFDHDTMVRKLFKALGDLEGSAVDLPSLPASPMPGKRTVRLVEMPISQGFVSLGHPGIRQDDPNRLTLQIMNGLLRQRINDRVRSDEGLAYSAYSRMTAPREHDGIFSAGFQTKSRSVAFALGLALGEIERMRKEQVPADELEGVKRGLIEGFPGQFSSAEAVVDLFARRELSGRPHAELESYRERVRAVTAEMILAAARKHLHPDRMTVVVVGPKKEILEGDGIHEDALGDFGEVEDVKLE